MWKNNIEQKEKYVTNMTQSIYSLVRSFLSMGPDTPNMGLGKLSMDLGKLNMGLDKSNMDYILRYNNLLQNFYRLLCNRTHIQIDLCKKVLIVLNK